MTEGIIRLLPDHLANQIAAGEVVQRPASVVKELLENAVDAGGTQIKLIIKDAGKQLIQVIDDGKGMSETDARLCFERHATSKISKQDDLYSIRTLGFRGEALASIAAVAQVELKTKSAEEELGTEVFIDASEIRQQGPVQCSKGTSISVKNLFFNVPARRNFLKSNPVESSHILNEFQRVALAFPSLGFSFYQNDLETYHLISGKLSHRIVGLFGKAYKEQLAPCQEETEYVKISGYIGKPQSAKKNRGEQFFFINQRYIKSNYLHHAVHDAFKGLIEADAHPFYVLFLEMDPSHIDINVHPTKTEVKFVDERTVYSLLHAAVKKSLGSVLLPPALDFEENVNFNPFGISSTSLGNQNYQNPSFLTEQSPQKSNQNFRSEGFSKSNQPWEQLYTGFENEKSVSQVTQTRLEGLNIPTEESVTKKSIQLHSKYVISQVKSGCLLIDVGAAFERIYFEQFQQESNQKALSQQILFPESIDFSANHFQILLELKAELESLGFTFSLFGGQTILLEGVPVGFESKNLRAELEQILEQFGYHQSQLKLSSKESLLRALAKRNASQHIRSLNDIEIQSMIDQLFACSNPHYTPDGKNILKLMGLDALEQLLHGS